jgi:predicted DNA-binding protein (MmcQ/YjbR family)
VSLAEIEAFCLSLPEATLAVQRRDDRELNIAGKMFAVIGSDAALSFKCSEVSFHMLTARPGIGPAPHLAHAHWVTLRRLDALPHEDLLDYLRAGYGLVVQRLPVAERARLTALLHRPPAHRD